MTKYKTPMTRVYIDAPLEAPLETRDGNGFRDFLAGRWQEFRDHDISLFPRHTMHRWLDTHPDNTGPDSDPARYAHEMTLDFLSGEDGYLDGMVMLTNRGEESAGMEDERRYAHAHMPYDYYPYFSPDAEIDVDDSDAELKRVLDRFDTGDWTRLYFGAPVSEDPDRFKERKREFLLAHYDTLKDRKINVHTPHETYTWIDNVPEHAGKDSPPEHYVMNMCVDFVGPKYEGVDAVLHLTTPGEETPRMREITAYAEHRDIPVYHHPLFSMDGTPLPEQVPGGLTP